mgnify:FL=1
MCMTLRINRHRIFDPNVLLPGYQLKLWLGPLGDGGNRPNGNYHASFRSLALEQIDFFSITIKDNFLPGEGDPLGVKYVKMHAPGFIPRVMADPQIGQDLFLQEGQTILKSLARNGIRCIEFFGGILRDVHNRPCILVLNESDGKWVPFARRLDEKSEPYNYALLLDLIPVAT